MACVQMKQLFGAAQTNENTASAHSKDQNTAMESFYSPEQNSVAEMHLIKALNKMKPEEGLARVMRNPDVGLSSIIGNVKISETDSSSPEQDSPVKKRKRSADNAEQPDDKRQHEKHMHAVKHYVMNVIVNAHPDWEWEQTGAVGHWTSAPEPKDTQSVSPPEKQPTGELLSPHADRLHHRMLELDGELTEIHAAAPAAGNVTRLLAIEAELKGMLPES